MTEDQPLAADMLIEINDWLNYIGDEIDHERLSSFEIIQLEQMYDIIKKGF